MKIGLVSLGCAKNLVDSEMVLALFIESGFEVVIDPENADVIVVNTCGFIDSSKQESIESIIEMAKYKKKLVVIGCLVERYLDDLKKAMPEVDLFIPLSQYPKMKELINGLFPKETINLELSPFRRYLSTPWYSAYLRISEGCNNCCSYCAIPIIRGGFKSRPIKDLKKEAAILASKGIKEVVVISQDTTRYGTDLEPKTSATELLKMLLSFKEFAYIRLLYLYPDELEDSLIELIAKEPRLTPYFDLPIQHASTHVLKAMRRRGDKAFLRSLILKIRDKVPHAIIRTTLIVGFPGETEADFRELLDFVEDMKFDHLGAFTYSREEGTPSYKMSHQVSAKVKTERYQELMKLQSAIAYGNNKKRIGTTMTGLVVGHSKSNGTYQLRSGYNAPDDIDGKIVFTSPKNLALGDIVTVKITGAFIYDLQGEFVS
ncbi:MAG: 30S ribosomal protein S12 methylthiotransferase RimO [Firmicutes bacterium]|nr:30S ribosomal protein S12 methylthiotransferase RimO [Bacillota bacterium]